MCGAPYRVNSQKVVGSGIAHLQVGLPYEAELLIEAKDCPVLRHLKPAINARRHETCTEAETDWQIINMARTIIEQVPPHAR